MKGALLEGGIPPSRIVDLAHDLPAHGVREAAFLFREMARGFPPRTVHVAVVDPGVGGRRQSVVIETRAGPFLVGPDNGVLFPLAQELGIRRAFRIDPATFRRSARVGTTFDGRDVFAPAAALLANGTSVTALGPPTVPKRYPLPKAARTRDGARGEVLHSDRFGNLITNIPARWVGARTARLTLRVGRVRNRSVPWVTSYESLGRGVLGTLGSSFGLLEVAVGEGRAADRLHAGAGSSVTVSGLPRRRAPGQTIYGARPRKPR